MSDVVYKGYKITKSSFSLNNVEGGKVFTVAPRFECKLTKSVTGFEAVFSVKVASVNDDMPSPFDITCEIVGNFETNVTTEKEDDMRFAIKTLFPFMRAHVAMMTANCCVPSLILPEIDIESMLGESSKPIIKEDLN